jgi:hypothetical protein
MAARRKSPAAPSLVRVAPPLPPPRPPRKTEPRGLSKFGTFGVRQNQIRAASAVDRDERRRVLWRVPRWQRGQKWSDEQAALYLNRLFQGIPAGTFFFEDRNLGGSILDREVYVVDGQQRLSALGAVLVREEDGSLNEPARIRFDPVAWLWEPGEASLLKPSFAMLADSLGWGMAMHRHVDPLNDGNASEQGEWLYDAIRVMQSIELHAITVETYPSEPRTQFIRDCFLALNSGGTPMLLGEAEGLLVATTSPADEAPSRAVIP